MKITKIPTDVLRATGSVMSERQIEGLLWGYFYRACRKRDRRANEMTRVNKATGLPESSNNLLPAHRAAYGTELALSQIIPPKDWVMATIYTDDLPENMGKPEDQKEWKALTYKKPNDWSEEEILAVNENTRRLKRIVHRLAETGHFITSPMIDEKPAELGTDRLVHGDDGMTMGFSITWKGIQYAEAFVKEHSFLAQEHTLLDAMGTTLAKQAPEWKKRELANDSIQINS